jgi:hypothetical protein
MVRISSSTIFQLSPPIHWVPHPSRNLRRVGKQPSRIRMYQNPLSSVNFSRHAQRTSPLPEMWNLPLPDIQLLPKTPTPGQRLRLRRLRTGTGVSPAAFRVCRSGLCTYARACPLTRQRAAQCISGNRSASTDTADIKQTEALRKPAILAAPLLRFQCMERREDPGKAQIHASKPGQARFSSEARGLALVQLPALRHRRIGNCRDRVTLDSLETRT